MNNGIRSEHCVRKPPAHQVNQDYPGVKELG